MLFKPDFDRAKLYWRAFWEKEMIDRPVVSITAPKNNTIVPEFDSSPNRTFRTCMSKDYDTYLKDYENYAKSIYFAGESIPAIGVDLGPDQFAAFLGSKIEAVEGNYTTWTHASVDDWSKFEVKIDKSEASYFNHVKEFYEYAANYSKGNYLISQLDLHSNIDSMSALRGPQDLCFDVMDEPEEVLRVLSEIDSVYDEVFMMAYKTGKMEERGSIGWAPTYVEQGKFAVVQCDFSCLLSPAQAREFAIPSIRKEASYLDKCVYHYDGKDALGHLEDILAIQEIDCIQWVPGEGQPRTLEWMELLKKIQKAGKSLWIFDWTVDEIKANFKELEPNKVAFSLSAASQDEADGLLEYLVKNV